MGVVPPRENVVVSFQLSASGHWANRVAIRRGLLGKLYHLLGAQGAVANGQVVAAAEGVRMLRPPAPAP